jgi:uncharacterized membrane protein
MLKFYLISFITVLIMLLVIKSNLKVYNYERCRYESVLTVLDVLLIILASLIPFFNIIIFIILMYLYIEDIERGSAMLGNGDLYENLKKFLNKNLLK